MWRPSLVKLYSRGSREMKVQAAAARPIAAVANWGQARSVGRVPNRRFPQRNRLFDNQKELAE